MKSNDKKFMDGDVVDAYRGFIGVRTGCKGGACKKDSDCKNPPIAGLKPGKCKNKECWYPK
jgi:hypothetical protein